MVGINLPDHSAFKMNVLPLLDCDIPPIPIGAIKPGRADGRTCSATIGSVNANAETHEALISYYLLVDRTNTAHEFDFA